jgi:hypothetical protein
VGYAAHRGPDPEYNLDSDIPAATHFPVWSAKRDDAGGLDAIVLRQGETRDPFWSEHAAHQRPDAPLSSVGSKQTPNPFDAMAVACFLQPSLCRTRRWTMKSMTRVYTRVGRGKGKF